MHGYIANSETMTKRSKFEGVINQELPTRDNPMEYEELLTQAQKKLAVIKTLKSGVKSRQANMTTLGSCYSNII